jgi:site-specific DNA-methyltransferase (adenine-specific)
MKKPYFKKDNFCLYQGDCRDILKDFPDNYVDMIFADPPYFLSNGGFTVHAGKMVKVDKGDWGVSNGVKKDFDFHISWLKEVKRVLKPEGTIWISGTYHSIYQCGFALQVGKFHILNDIAWFKPNTSPNLSCRFFTASHETLIWAKKDKKAKHYFNYDLMKNGNWPEDTIKKPNLQMRSVWSIYPPKKEEKIFGKHPTQKPIELLRRCILAATPENAIILDPFNGGGTNGIASEVVGGNRKYIGIDTEKEYLDLTIERYNQIKSNNNLI